MGDLSIKIVDANALPEFKVLVDRMKSTSSRTGKEEILKEYKDNTGVKFILYFVYNPYIITGISKKKIDKASNVTVDLKGESYWRLWDIIDLINYLQTHNHGSDKDLAMVRKFIKDTENHYNSNMYEELIKSIVTKDLTLGCTAVTLNKIFGKDFIPTFDVMVPERYFENPDKYVPEGTVFIISQKLDGVRCVLVFDDLGTPHFMSRQGKEIFGLVDLIRESEYLNRRYVYDGELLIVEKEGESSNDRYRDTMSVVGSDDLKHNIEFHIFDRVLKEDFQRGYSSEKCIDRKEDVAYQLEGIAAIKMMFRYMKCVPNLYVGSDRRQIQTWLDYAHDYGWEGVCLNIAAGPYECKRSRQLLKVKTFFETEVYVTGVEEGSGRNAGKLGAAVVEMVDSSNVYHTVRVGGGFTDEMRERYWKNPELIVGKVAEVSYFEITNNKADNSLSLRFPVWLDRIRIDKTKETMTPVN